MLNSITMKKVVIINGPNLNLLGIREKSIYGSHSFENFLSELSGKYPEIELVYKQSNIEGEIINYLHEHGFSAVGIIINPGGYSHTSVSIADAIKAIQSPVIEVHISNIHAREEYRHRSLTGSACLGIISGLGLKGYELALNHLINNEM